MDTAWTKASHSYANGNCVEVARASGRVLVRDSKDPHGPVLTFTRAGWEAFLAAAKNGEFDALASLDAAACP
jgi:hypothetical protein